MLEDATVETEYAALSYVWGETAHEYHKPSHTAVGSGYPQTIRDSFEVTQELGLKYIWIDQLCIDQEGVHKAEQIRQMHHIYNNAELTIVAAAGFDSAHGREVTLRLEASAL
ncbi:hypothetical protein SLS58_009229 [Diplodia intermedia]|uniref:Heterokaryon incompatibility domain-containing protein n=1 Tax=Diplodia intermedia TaxID=856260 RepID=A0ABR3TDH1_9PEZI